MADSFYSLFPVYNYEGRQRTSLPTGQMLIWLLHLPYTSVLTSQVFILSDTWRSRWPFITSLSLSSSQRNENRLRLSCYQVPPEGPIKLDYHAFTRAGALVISCHQMTAEFLFFPSFFFFLSTTVALVITKS